MQINKPFLWCPRCGIHTYVDPIKGEEHAWKCEHGHQIKQVVREYHDNVQSRRQPIAQTVVQGK